MVNVDESGEVDLTSALRYLQQERGVGRVLCEGSPTLNASLARRGLLDEFLVTTTLRLSGYPNEPRIVSSPVTDRPLHLVSELHHTDETVARA